MTTSLGHMDLLNQISALYRNRQYDDVQRLLSGIDADKLLEEPELGFYFGATLVAVGAITNAVEWLPKLQAACIARGNMKLLDRCLNLEAAINIELGRLKSAENTLRDLLARLDPNENLLLLAGVANNLGVIATMQCYWDEALVNYGRALTFMHQLGEHGSYVLFHHNVGMAYRELGFYRAAASHFDYALAYAVENRLEKESIYIGFERALLMALMGDLELAKGASAHALSRARALGDPHLEIEAKRTVGAIAIHAGDWARARNELEDALRSARQLGARLLQAETLEQVALLEERTEHLEACQAAAAEATAIYMQMGADRRAQRMLEALGLKPKGVQN